MNVTGTDTSDSWLKIQMGGWTTLTFSCDCLECLFVNVWSLFFGSGPRRFGCNDNWGHFPLLLLQQEMAENDGADGAHVEAPVNVLLSLTVVVRLMCGWMTANRQGVQVCKEGLASSLVSEPWRCCINNFGPTAGSPCQTCNFRTSWGRARLWEVRLHAWLNSRIQVRHVPSASANIWKSKLRNPSSSGWLWSIRVQTQELFSDHPRS